MKIEYYIADVFTKQLFNGAQIAVFPNADGLSDATMQLLARELNLSETVFVFHPEKSDTKRLMRVFSPKKELDFAGHPIIATAYVLGLCGDVPLQDGITPIILEQNIGPIDVNITAIDGKPTFVQFARTVVSN
jgi:trans-2,3-dihydro-3-hydroxyanthranilate isomerase